MSKLILTDLDNLENQSTAVSSINANNSLIETSLENTLSRNGATPNTMLASLDMNSNRILNLPAAVLSTEPVRLAEVGDAAAQATAAAVSAAAALVSQSAASTSATSAATSATASATSATASASSATSAAASAVAAASAAGVNITGMTNHGVMIATGASAGTSLGVMTNGQLLVGQTGANPAATTVTGDVTINSSGVTAIKTSPSFTTPLLGTPTSGTLTNCTGLPVAGITSSTSTALGVGTLELGAASDTTLSRASAGVLAVEGVSVYSNIPINSQSAAYPIVLADANTAIYHPGADTTARTFTIPANASVAFPTGTTLTFVNDTLGGVITIAITSDTLVFAPSGSTGPRSLAASGIATAIKMTSTRWMISGTGLT